MQERGAEERVDVGASPQDRTAGEIRRGSARRPAKAMEATAPSALYVDGALICTLAAPAAAALAPRVDVAVATGYERDAAAWRALRGARLVAATDADGAQRLRAYCADLARPREGRLYGKAAVLKRDGAASVIIAPVPCDNEGRCRCLFRVETPALDVAVTVRDERGQTTASFTVRGEVPVAALDVRAYRCRVETLPVGPRTAFQRCRNQSKRCSRGLDRVTPAGTAATGLC